MKPKLILCLALFLSRALLVSAAPADPADGWTPEPLRFEIQSPYNLPHSDRSTYDARSATYHLWVFRTDMPDAKSSTRPPRTEMSFDKYSSGRHQFAADVMVMTNTSSVTIMQVFGGEDHHDDSAQRATSLQLRVYDGKLKCYDKDTLLSDIYGKWFHLNVTHDAGTHEIQVFINGKLAMTVKDNGGKEWHMKCGVYAQKEAKGKMDVLYRNIKIYRK
ncbi:MAG TPA: polysaccharide lyase family 7 protein [Verrucomicrobiae bacterium]